MNPSALERRRQPRVARQETIAYTVFSVRYWAETDTFSFNLSEAGVGFIARQRIAPRTVVCIRSTPAGRSSGRDIQMPLRALAEVKWCRERVGQEGPIFEIGASYL
jgi:hypothetical protein